MAGQGEVCHDGRQVFDALDRFRPMAHPVNVVVDSSRSPSLGVSRAATLVTLESSRPRAGLSSLSAVLATPPTHISLTTQLRQQHNSPLTSPQPPKHNHPSQNQQSALVDHMTTDIQNLKSFDPFAEADDTGGETKTSQQNYIHIRIQRKYSLQTPADWSRLYSAPSISS